MARRAWLPFLLILTAAASGSEAAVRLNEFVTGNLTGITDEDGDHEDWIEVVNTGPAVVNLAGCGLSDDPADPLKWTFPTCALAAGQRLLVFASGKDRTGAELHANFKLDSGGEPLLLADAAGDSLDRVDTGPLPGDIARGRLPDGGGDWLYFVEPTPDLPNKGPGCIGIAEAPDFSVPPGHCPAAFDLALSAPSPAATITYTLDGSDPDAFSISYLAPIPVAETAIVRARCFQAEHVPSRIATSSYLFGESSSLPIVSLVTDPDNLWADETGIYVLGDDYDPEFPHYGANFWQDWERPAHFELFEPDGALGVALDLGIKIHGGWTRAFPQKSLRLCARGGYGAAKIDYRMFADLDIDEFEFLILRNSGNDWCITHFRDALMQGLTAGFDLDVQAYRPAVVFINGEYWGIHNIRERIDEHYLASHHGVDPDAVDLLELQYEEVAGDNGHYLAMLDFIAASDMTDDAVYQQVQALMDTDNFATYNIFEIFFGNTDWPGNNLKYWRPRAPDGRWRWLLFDLDYGLGIGVMYYHDTLAYALAPDGPDWPNPTWATYLLRKLMENGTFRRDFINRYADLLNTRLRTGVTTAALDSIRAGVEPEMARHMARWDSTITSWEDNIDVARDFLTWRPQFARSHIQNAFGLPGTWNLRLDVSPHGAGAVALTAAEIDSTFTGTYFQGNPVPVTARPASGFVFAGWSDPGLPPDPAALLEPAGDSYELKAFFAGAVINEINYNSADAFDPGDWVELHNPTGLELDLGGWQFKDEVDDHVFTLPPGTSLPAGGYLVLCENLAAFSAFFPGVAGAMGDLGYGLSGGGELLRLFDAAGTLIDDVEYDDAPPWPEEADGDGPTLELKNPLADNSLAGAWAASEDHGTPGERNSAFEGTPVVDGGAPAALVMAPAWPNPFNPVTHLAFALPEAGRVRLAAYDVRGRLADVILDGELAAGRHEVRWSAAGHSSGVYLVRLEAGGRTLSRKVVLLK